MIFLYLPKSLPLCFFQDRLLTPNSVNLCRLKIPVKKHYKYLGIFIDNKLNWKEHTEHVKNRCEKGMNMIGSMRHIFVP